MTSARCDALNLDHLRTFQLVMQHGGYAAAARQSHLSVPSIWQHIRSVEQAYGVQLFHKRGRRVEPTTAARQLYEQVEQILVSLDSTFELVGHSPSAPALRLVTGVRMMLEDLPGPLAKFRRSDPRPLVIRHAHDRRAEDLLLADEADLALALEPNLQTASDQIHYEPAYTVEFLAVARRNHPYIQSRQNSLNELVKHELIVTTRGTHGRDALDDALHRQDLTANITVETDNSAFTFTCVAAGMGVGILAGRSDTELSKRLVTRSLSKHLGNRRIVLMWRRGRILSDSMCHMIDCIKSELGA